MHLAARTIPTNPGIFIKQIFDFADSRGIFQEFQIFFEANYVKRWLRVYSWLVPESDGSAAGNGPQIAK